MPLLTTGAGKYAAVGGGGPPTQYWNTATKAAAGIALSNDATYPLTATGSVASYAGAMGILGASTGKKYWSLVVTNAASAGDFAAGGVMGYDGAPNLANWAATTYLGANNFGGGYYRDGRFVFANVALVSNAALVYTTGDRICFALDIPNKRLWVKKGTGGTWNNDGSADPSTNTNGLNVTMGAGASNIYYPVTMTGNTSSGDIITADFITTTGMPSGFSVW